MSGFDDVLLLEQRGSVLHARLNRPGKGNSLSRALLAALDGLGDDLRGGGARQDVRAVVLSGEGGKAFCAGADINDLAGLSEREAVLHMLWGQEILQKFEDAPQVIIAAIDGVAFGGGLELAMACDLRIASPASRLGQPEITLANIPGWGGTQRLPRIVGEGRALEMILTGAPIAAEEARTIGLVNQVHEDAVAAATSLAERIAGMSPVAVAGAKHAVYAGVRHGIVHGLLEEARYVGVCCASPEQHRAVQAFFDRKKVLPATDRQGTS